MGAVTRFFVNNAFDLCRHVETSSARDLFRYELRTEQGRLGNRTLSSDLPPTARLMEDCVSAVRTSEVTSPVLLEHKRTILSAIEKPVEHVGILNGIIQKWRHQGWDVLTEDEQALFKESYGNRRSMPGYFYTVGEELVKMLGVGFRGIDNTDVRSTVGIGMDLHSHPGQQRYSARLLSDSRLGERVEGEILTDMAGRATEKLTPRIAGLLEQMNNPLFVGSMIVAGLGVN